MANPFLFMEDVSAAQAPATADFDNPFLVEDDDDDELMQQQQENPFSAGNPFAFAADNSSVVATTTASDLYGSDTVTQTNASLFLVDDDDDEDEQMMLAQQQQQQQQQMLFEQQQMQQQQLMQQQQEMQMQQQQQPMPVVNDHHVDRTMAFFGTTIDEADEDEHHQKPQRPAPPSQVTQQLITNLTDHLDATSHNLLGKIPVTQPPSPVSMRDLQSPSPTPDVDDLLDVTESFAAASAAQQEAPKPHRPPPPSRPTPPSRPSPPKQSPTDAPLPTVVDEHKEPEDDLLSFGPPHQQKKPPPKPPAPKTKDDILSLYSADATPQRKDSKDLLSEEIDFSVANAAEQMETSPVKESAPVPSYLDNIPTIEMTLTTEDNRTDSDQEDQISSGGISVTPSENDVGIIDDVAVSAVSNVAPPVDLTPPEQLEKLRFLQEKSDDYIAPRPTTPDPIVAQPELAPIFGGPMPTQSQISPSKVAPPPPTRGSSVLTTVQQSVTEQHKNHQNAFSSVPEITRSDDFDEFAAKFDSVQTKSTGNAFLDSLGMTSPAVTSDAWGDDGGFGDGNAADNGFGNEDGFDSWEAPAAPESTPYKNRRGSRDSDEENFSVVIKPKTNTEYATAPQIAPPTAVSKPAFSGEFFTLIISANVVFNCVVICFKDISRFAGTPKVNPFEQGFAETQQTTCKL